MVLLRHLLGDALRRLRLRQGRTLREVSATARVSLGYLSEVERGRKEASSELLASICDALGAPLSQVLREVSDGFALAELQSEPAYGIPLEPALVGAPGVDAPDVDADEPPVSARPAADKRAAMRVSPTAGPQRLVMPQRAMKVGADQRVTQSESLLEPVTLPGRERKFEKLAREITDMVPV
jgi:XRE family transcriptional regulator, stress-response regulator